MSFFCRTLRDDGACDDDRGDDDGGDHGEVGDDAKKWFVTENGRGC